MSILCIFKFSLISALPIKDCFNTTPVRLMPDKGRPKINCPGHQDKKSRFLFISTKPCIKNPIFYTHELQEILSKLADVGYTAVYGPDLAVDGSAPERSNYTQVVLVDSLRQAIHRLNPQVPLVDTLMSGVAPLSNLTQTNP